jgi:hypothetical protein
MAFLSAAHRLFVAAIIRGRPSGLRRRFFLAGFAGAGVAAFGFRAAAQRFLCAAALRRRAAGRTMRLGASSRANATVLSKSRDQYPYAAPERARGDPGFERRSEVLSGGLDALPTGGGDSLAVEDLAKAATMAAGKAQCAGANGWLAGSSFPDRDFRPASPKSELCTSGA